MGDAVASWLAIGAAVLALMFVIVRIMDRRN
jgi:hypothetical protein